MSGHKVVYGVSELPDPPSSEAIERFISEQKLEVKVDRLLRIFDSIDSKLNEYEQKVTKTITDVKEAWKHLHILEDAISAKDTRIDSFIKLPLGRKTQVL